MKKKTKIVGTISAMVISIGMLSVGVWSATNVSLGVSSSVSFEATGVYVMAEGSVLRGTSTSSLTALEEQDRPSTEAGASYTYKGHSYTPTSGSDDTPNGSSSFETMTAWTVGTVEFTESEKVIQYKLDFTNYSEFPIMVNITDNSSTFEGVTPEVVGSSLNISSEGKQTYTLTLTLNSVATSLDFNLELNVDVQKFELTPEYYTAPEIEEGQANSHFVEIKYDSLMSTVATAVDVWYDGKTYYGNITIPETIDRLDISALRFDGNKYYADFYGDNGKNFSQEIQAEGGYHNIKVRWVDANGNFSPWSETIYFVYQCLTGDTWITMSDGKKKRLKDIKKGDKVLAVDPETGKLSVAEVTATDTDEIKYAEKYTIWYLSDGTKIKTVNKHRFYNEREKKMMFLEDWKVGDSFIKEDGTRVQLMKKRTINKQVRHFTLNTTHENYFANGMLSGNYHTKPMSSDTFQF